MKSKETLACRGTQSAIEPIIRELDMVVTLYRLKLAVPQAVEHLKAKLSDILPIGVTADDCHKLFRVFTPDQRATLLDQLWKRHDAILSNPETTRFPTAPIKVPHK